MSLPACPSGNTDSGSFSSILQTIGQLLNPSSPLPISSEVTVDQTGSKGLHLSTSVGAKHDSKSASTSADCHGQAKALDLPAALHVSAPDQNAQITPILAHPVVTPALSSDAQDLTSESQPVAPATQSQGQPLGPASVTGTGTSTEPGNSSETTALPNAPTGLGPIVQLAVKSTATETTEAAALDPTEPANALESATASTTELAPAIPVESSTPGATGLAMATPTRTAGTVATESTAPTPNKLTVANAIPAAAANTPSPLSPTVPKTAPEQNPPVVPTARTPETSEAHSPVGKPASKPEPASEILSFQAHRVSENPLNLSAGTTATKTEIVNMLAATKGSEASLGPVALDTAPVVPQPAQGQGTSTITPVEKTPADAQSTAAFLHTSDDGAGNSKGQSQKDNSPTFTTSAVTASTAETGLTQGSSGSDGFGSTASLMQSALVSSANKDANATGPGKSPVQVAEQPGHTSTGTVEGHNSSGSTVYPTSLLSSAKLVERMGESELRLGIRAGEFGNVDIRTSMARNQFTAEISVERGELGRVLAAELPSLQNRLSEQRIPVTNIVLQNPSGGNSGQSEQQKPREGQPMPSSSYETPREETAATPNPAAFAGAAEPGLRLDIHM
jgi:hypothetical protein